MMSPTIRTGIITGLATRYSKKSREKIKTEVPIPLAVGSSGPAIKTAKTASVAMNATKLWRSPLLNGRTKPMNQPIALNPNKNRKSNPASSAWSSFTLWREIGEVGALGSAILFGAGLLFLVAQFVAAELP